MKYFWKYTWFIRQAFYKIKMFKRFSKHLIKEWECINAIFHIPMEVFIDFYKHNIIRNNHIDWSFHSEEKKIMDEIYHYYIVERPLLEDLHETSLSNWCFLKHMVFIPDGDSKHLFTLEGNESKEIDAWYNLTDKYEKELKEKDDKYIKELVSIRNFLWT